MNFKALYEVKQWDASSDELKITAIFEDFSSKEIQIILPKDKQMNEHNAPGDIIVQVLKGEIEFMIEGKTILLKELDSIKVLAKIMHSLKAKKDSIIRLSLAKSDDISRVKNVEIS